jgi:K+-transporting ATPase ATPase C chain
MRRQLFAALAMTIAMTVLTGLIYPLAVTGASQVLFKHKANGSLIERNGKIVGSALVGQNFASAKYFQPRPSAAGSDGYDGLSSGASNLGPSNPKLLDAVKDRVAAYREANGLGPDDAVPVDAVTGSGSGLDPQISVANARLQAPRVARERRLPVAGVLALVGQHTQHRPWGFLGEDAVNVLTLNLALDATGTR